MCQHFFWEFSDFFWEVFKRLKTGRLRHQHSLRFVLHLYFRSFFSLFRLLCFVWHLVSLYIHYYCLISSRGSCFSIHSSSEFSSRPSWSITRYHFLPWIKQPLHPGGLHASVSLFRILFPYLHIDFTPRFYAHNAFYFFVIVIVYFSYYNTLARFSRRYFMSYRFWFDSPSEMWV